tara:strand:- start:628 stop:1191 length:564 start_codon:yes stop_codon:yes gene_type:complete
MLERPWQQCQDAFLQAWSYRPVRAEPLWQLSRLYRQNGNPRLAYLYSKSALDTPFPENDILFIAHDLWDWAILDEVAATAYYVNRFEEGLAATNLLLRSNKVPAEHLGRIKDNVKFYKDAIAQQQKAIQERDIRQKEIQENEGFGDSVNPKKTYKKRKGKSKKGPTAKTEKSTKHKGNNKLVRQTLK